VTPPPPAALRSLSAPAVSSCGGPAAGAPVSGVPAPGGGRALPSVDAAVFRQALARHPAGVAIVTLRGPAGLTVTSFSSASLDPPLVSFYIGHGSSNWPAVRAAEYFAVNLMDHGQEAVAARFARKGADRFGPQTRWRPGPGDLPLLAGATTHLLCATHGMLTVGDHELVVGRVEHAIIGSGEPPLLHHQGRFTRPEPGIHHDH
jgi:flavin reductase (DIM6/NTAB) family NADH-FMN oxidoreductase RutF